MSIVARQMRMRVLFPVAIAAAAVAVLPAATEASTTGGAASATAPFARSWAHVPRSQGVRRARRILVFGQEQAVAGFNTSLNCCAQSAAAGQTLPVIRGAFITNNRLQHVKDLVTEARATATTLSYTIRRNAFWNWGGKKIPVTYQDFVYTWQQLVDPKNDVASRDGYDQITGYTHEGEKQVTFTWAKPFAAWQLLFSTVYPSAALQGQDFNTIWRSCICGSDGKPVSDGPFMLTNFTGGEGSTLKPNKYWYGKKPRLREIDFKVIADTNGEVFAMRTHRVDVINPTFGINLLPLRTARGLTYNQVPSLDQEHIDIQFGSQGQPLLRAPWMRRALMMGIDRAAIIKTIFGEFAATMKPLDNVVYYQPDPAYRPDFRKWNYNPRKALALMKRHCTDGPSTVGGFGATWVCSGITAKFRYTWTTSNATRALQEALVKDQLKRIGIEIDDAPLPASVVFSPTGIPSANYDLANFAWTTAPDPASFVQMWSCGGESNFTRYCSSAASNDLAAAGMELDPAKRRALFQHADALLARDLPSIPLYSRPNPLIWRSAVVGLKNNPSPAGFAWNAETWHWRR
jgi:peptide/nickel transport system substrate-binding protein